jgi:copper transport protein
VSLRRVTIAFAVAAGGALLYVPIYLLYATAAFALRSPLDVGTLVPLFRTTAFGRGYVDLELCFALFCIAAVIAIWIDRPEREARSIAEIIAGLGVLASAAAVLIVPGAAGHAAQTSPRGLSLALDWAHLASGSIWLGGLIGLFVVWRALPEDSRLAGFAVIVPRFSTAAFWSVLVLLGTGIAATVIHMPILAALWETSYGKAILVKSGLLVAALALAAFNLLRHKPALVASDGDETSRLTAAALIRLFAGAEAVLALSAVFVAAILTSLAPPPPSLARAGSALAHVGPGKVASVVHKDGYTLKVLVSPNKAVATNSFALEIDKNGVPLRGADVKLTFAMLDMQMADQLFQLTETKPGIYSRPTPAFVMAGHWGLSFDVTPKSGAPFTAVVVDRAAG